MEKTREKSFLNIKSKLMAAVAMLLVAFFMVISSSYAWFTLSTAPEVTGIYTAVGANGNLEIALYTGTTPTASGVSDSAINDTTGEYNSAKNITWGNIVDLSDNDVYGLDLISLLPAKLNLNSNGTLNTTAPLLTPTYGSDGRVQGLEGNTTTASFDVDDGAFSDATKKGVRAIGNASGMTAQQLAYRNARSQASSSVSLALSNTKSSLESHASALADIMIEKATDSAGTSTGYDISFASDMITKLNTANNNIAVAILAYLDGYIAKLAQDANETDYQIAANLVPDTVATTPDAATGLTITAVTGESTVYQTNITYNTQALPVPADIYEAYLIYQSNAAAIGAAETALTSRTNQLNAASWEDVKAVFVDTGLVKVTDITINGYGYNDLKQNMFTIYSAALTTGVSVVLPDGSGVHANIAEVCGNYSIKNVDITIPQEVIAEFAGFDTGEDIVMKATMSTDVEMHYDIDANLVAVGAPAASGASTNTDITDFYGYIIDLAFRTNASESNLLLSTDALNRIYSENGVEETMGKGSTMSFTLVDGFTTLQAEKLMSAIRFVFVDSNNEIVAVGGLSDAEAQGTTNVTADLILYAFDMNIDSTGASAATLTIRTDSNGAYVPLDATADDVNSQNIMALTQNEVELLSVYVYLDGEKVDNSMVANGDFTMSGTLNLQFCSDKTLKPMDYTPLQDQTPAQGDQG